MSRQKLPMHYQTSYAWRGTDSQGSISVAGCDDLAVGSPFEDGRFSPEHLLVATAEICFANYVLLIAKKSRIALSDYRSHSEGELIQDNDHGFRFERIRIFAEISAQGCSEAELLKVIDKAHHFCLISRSLNFPVEIQPTLHLSG